MNIYIDIVLAITFGGTSGGIVYFLTKTYFSEKIKASIKSDYDKELEHLRGEITRNHTIINSVLNSQNQAFQLGHSERLLSIKTLWTNYITIRDSLSIVNTCDEILFENEFNTLFTEDWKGNDFVYQTLRTLSLDHITHISNAQKCIETIRPFISEQIWIYIVYLKTFSGRIIYLYTKGCNEKAIKHWKNDKALIKLVKDALTTEEFKSIEQTDRASVKLFQNIIEQKLLIEIHKIITGQVAADNAYERALKLTDIAKPLK